jgi:hypothetical protein
MIAGKKLFGYLGSRGHGGGGWFPFLFDVKVKRYSFTVGLMAFHKACWHQSVKHGLVDTQNIIRSMVGVASKPMRRVLWQWSTFIGLVGALSLHSHRIPFFELGNIQFSNNLVQIPERASPIVRRFPHDG